MADEDDLMSICTQGLVPRNVVPYVPDYDSCDTFHDFLSQVIIPAVPSIYNRIQEDLLHLWQILR